MGSKTPDLVQWIYRECCQPGICYQLDNGDFVCDWYNPMFTLAHQTYIDA